MDPRLDAQLRDALVQFLRGEGLIQEASRLPVVASQAVQSGQGAPVPQQTLGPKPGEPRPVSRQQWMNDFGQAAGSFGASVADPLNIPSALLGVVAPGARDWWRQYAAAAGPEVQLAGGLASGFGVGNAMLRGGNALAGMPGMIAAGAATGAGPVIDNAAGAPGSSPLNAMIAPAVGAAPMVGQMARNYALPAAGLAAAGGLALTVGNSDVNAQGTQPALDPAIADLHRRDARLAELYRQLQSAREASRTAAAASMSANQGRNTNSGARQNAAAAAAAEQTAQSAYNEALAAVQDRYRQQNRTFAEAFPMIAENPFLATTLPAAVLGALRAGGSAAATRYQNRPINAMVTGGNANIANGQIPQAAANAAGARAAFDALNAAPAPTWGKAVNTTVNRLGNALSGPTAGAFVGAEMSMLPQQYNAMYAPANSPEAQDAMAFWSDPSRIAMRGALGAAGGVGGNLFGYKGTGSLAQMLPGGVSPGPAVAGLEARVKALQQQTPSAPAVPAAAQPQTSNMPIDYEAISRGIRPQFDRPPFVPPAQQAIPVPAAPVPPAAQPNTNLGASLYVGNLQASIREQLAAQLTGPSGAINVGAMVSRMRREGLRPGVIERAQAAAQSANALVQSGVPAADVARRITAGDFRNLAIPAGVVGAGAAAHHSATQPRGDDGRFQTLQE